MATSSCNGSGGVTHERSRRFVPLLINKFAAVKSFASRRCHWWPASSLPDEPHLRHRVHIRLATTGLTLATALMVASGGVLLGVVALARNRTDTPTPPIAALSPSPDDATIRGRVVDSSDFPVLGAEVALALESSQARTRLTTRSGFGGQFVLDVPAEFRDLVARLRNTPLRLLVQAPGHGVGWASVAAEGPTVVHLADEGPAIEGRILDEAGQPVVGATVVVKALYEPQPKGLDEERTARLDRILKVTTPQVLLTSADRLEPIQTATTDDAGAFSIRGLGPERMASLEISGSTIVTTEISVATRDGVEDFFQPPGGRMLKTQWYYFSKLTFTAQPTRIVAGVVRNLDTGRPLDRVRVTGKIRPGSTIEVESWTDAAGKYRLVGLPDSPTYSLSIKPRQWQPYPELWFTSRPGSGREPVAFDLEVRRAVLLRGRITDRATGRPVRGWVEALPCPGAPPVVGYPGFDEAKGNARTTDEEGRYELPIPPGRSLIAVNYNDSRRNGEGAEKLPGYDPASRRLPPNEFHSSILTTRYQLWSEVNTSPDAESATLDFQVDLKDRP